MEINRKFFCPKDRLQHIVDRHCHKSQDSYFFWSLTSSSVEELVNACVRENRYSIVENNGRTLVMIIRHKEGNVGIERVQKGVNYRRKTDYIRVVLMGTVIWTMYPQVPNKKYRIVL
jgi:hypothetical protein